MKRATVAIVGRMNVGKSTLFNRLSESSHAIISSWAGTTRDVNTAPVIWRGMEFDLVDTGGLDVLHDDDIEDRVISAAQKATQAADLILFVVDGITGLLPQDKKIAKELSASKTPIFLVVNKIDTDAKHQAASEDIYKLNIEPVHFVSSTNGRGTGDLLDEIYNVIDPIETAIVDEEVRTKVAIVGRPNVGKSSMLNAILGEDRVIVSEQAHTTRDTNDIKYEYGGEKFMLIDTAGIRRRTKVGQKWSDKRLGAIEKQSVRNAIHAMERADVVLLVLEAQKRITAQDKKIADLANEYGKGLIVVINKWDTIEEKDSNTIDEFSDYFDQGLPYLRWAPLVFVSAKEGLRVRSTLDMVVRVAKNYNREIEMEDLAPVMRVVKKVYKPKQSATRKFRKVIVDFKRLKQIDKRPPRFYLKASRPKDVPKAIPKIIERELRDQFDFEGVKIIIEIGT